MRVKVCNQEKKTKGEKIPFSISSPCDYNVKTKKLPRMTQEFCSTCILFILTVFHKPMTGFRGNIFPLPSAFSLIRVLGLHSDRTKGVVKRERVREMERKRDGDVFLCSNGFCGTPLSPCGVPVRGREMERNPLA